MFSRYEKEAYQFLAVYRFLAYALVIPSFVIDELQFIADSPEPSRQGRGRKGLETLNELRKMEFMDLRIHESTLDRRQEADAKLIFIAESLKAKILTTDYNLAQVAEFHNVDWLNLNELAKVMSSDLFIGETIEIELVKAGKEAHQGIGYLTDGSMVVVNEGRRHLGEQVRVRVDGIIPSSGGKMVFGSLAK